MTNPTPIGAVVFVLHTHLPYVRQAVQAPSGQAPYGEDWLHEAAIESYIPLLIKLQDLMQAGIRFRVTLSITPVLAEQIGDPVLREHFDRYLDGRIQAAERDYARFEHGIGHLRYLAGWTRDYYTRIRTAYNERLGRDVLQAICSLQEAGVVELAASAATHGYLPSLSDESVRAQIMTGVATHTRVFGRPPRSFWMPECGYRPGIEAVLARAGVQVTFTETHAITGGAPVGLSAGDGVRPYGAWTSAAAPAAEAAPAGEGRKASTFYPYYIAGRDGLGTGVSALGRSARAGQQVWSGETGYPGDGDYREFHRYDPESGLKYWRVTEKHVPLGHKDMYHPDWAAYKVEQHAEHYAHLVGDMLRKHHRKTGDFGVVLAAFDTELFGHWWFEGVDWLGETLRHLADFPEIALTTAHDVIAEHPPTESLALSESSWGMGGAHLVWDNDETRWMWDAIHQAEAEMRAVMAEPAASPEADAVRAQMARELLLMQSSDWAFMVATQQTRAYGEARFRQHAERFRTLAASLAAGQPDTASAAAYLAGERVFEDIRPEWFGPETT